MLPSVSRIGGDRSSATAIMASTTFEASPVTLKPPAVHAPTQRANGCFVVRRQWICLDEADAEVGSGGARLDKRDADAERLDFLSHRLHEAFDAPFCRMV